VKLEEDKNMNKQALIILASLLILCGAVAAKDVDETVALDPKGVVDIELIAGKLTITGWEKSEVRVTGTIDEDREELDISGSGSRVSIELEPLRGRHDSHHGAELDIRVPMGARLDIEAISADVSIEDVEGEMEVEVVSGPLVIRGGALTIAATSVSGKIDVVADILLDGDFECLSGKIDVTAALDPKGEFNFEVFSGNLTLRLPSDTSAEFDIETFSGDIVNEFGPKARKTSDFLPAKVLSFSTGSGGAEVSIETFQGSVKLIKD